MVKKRVLYTILGVVLVFLFLLALVLSFFYRYYGRIYPGVSVNGISLGGKTPAEAEDRLSDLTLPETLTLTTVTEAGVQTYSLPISTFDARYDIGGAVSKAYGVGRAGNLASDLISIGKINGKEHSITMEVLYDTDKLSESLGAITSQVLVLPIAPSIKLNGSEIVVDRGMPGQEVDIKALATRVILNMRNGESGPIQFSAEVVDPTLSEEQILSARERGEKMMSKEMVLTFEHESPTYSKGELLALLDPHGGYSEEAIAEAIESLSNTINREPQNPSFVFQDGKVQEFAPAKSGVEVNQQQLQVKIEEALASLENTENQTVTLEVPYSATEPQLSTSEVNNLGIKELIGRGTSTYRGSIPSRVHNVALAASKISGTLVAPGETFSFNQALGDVSKFTGFKEAYVIQNGKTVLGDGGGVCQVSTTLFRAALDAGLPITERRAHSYRVGYYEQGFAPGLDATVFAPTTDFKFTNDTPAHILVQAYPDTQNYSLVFELYGTSDGRVATTTKPVIFDSTPPPEDLYVDDPTLPTGQVKQVEYKAWGAKVRFDYTVVRNGETLIEKTFYSTYRPWQAVFMRGTAPAPTT